MEAGFDTYIKTLYHAQMLVIENQFLIHLNCLFLYKTDLQNNHQMWILEYKCRTQKVYSLGPGKYGL